MTFIASALSLPQDAAMLIAGGIATILYFLCSGVLKGKRCNTSRLLMFAASAAGMVAGVYLFFSALNYALAPHKGGNPGSYQNSVSAGCGCMGVSACTVG